MVCTGAADLVYVDLLSPDSVCPIGAPICIALLHGLTAAASAIAPPWPCRHMLMRRDFYMHLVSAILLGIMESAAWETGLRGELYSFYHAGDCHTGHQSGSQLHPRSLCRRSNRGFPLGRCVFCRWNQSNSHGCRECRRACRHRPPCASASVCHIGQRNHDTSRYHGAFYLNLHIDTFRHN